jgi:hypothetical protein
MHTVQEIKEMIAEYRKDYPDLKSKVSIEALEAMEEQHGSGAIDECYDVIVNQFEGEIEVLELVKLGVPYTDAVMQVYNMKGAGDDAQV